MRVRRGLRSVVWLCVLLWVLSGSSALAEDEPTKSPGVLDRIGNTAKKVGNKIEQGFAKAGRKIEEKQIGEKIERKLKKAATKTAEGFKKAGDKIDQRINH
jgi:hypothetical protein